MGSKAAIKHIQAKACGLSGAEHLFLKLRQIDFLRRQKRYKTLRTSASRFETDPKFVDGVFFS